MSRLESVSDWINPFGLGQNVAFILPFRLGLGLLLPPVSPSKFLLQGGARFGQTSAAMVVSYEAGG